MRRNGAGVPACRVAVLACAAAGLAGLMLTGCASVRPANVAAARSRIDTDGGRYPGAPPNQRYRGYVGSPCSAAPRNRYLPAHIGCLTVLRVDIDGSRRPDLLLLYSRLSRRPVSPGKPGRAKGMYGAAQAVLEVVRPSGVTVSAPVRDAWAPGKYYNPGSARVIAVAHVNDDPGDEVFVEVGETSSGSTALAYGFYDGRLAPSGVLLGFGGDSGAQGRFDCLPGSPPRLVQRIFEEGASRRYQWIEVVTTYAWHGPRLVQVEHRTIGLGHFNFMPGLGQDTGIGHGCVTGISPS